MPRMLGKLVTRRFKTLRLAVLLVFACGVAAQSLLGVLGEMHELTAHATAGAGVADHLTPHEHQVAAETGGGAEEGSPLHVLLHYTHCCAHSIWISGAAAPHDSLALSAIAAPADVTPQVAASRLTAPFRPPIQA
jgi:hypothetical protein